MENEKVLEMLAKVYENMTDDQKKRALECETAEDFMAIVEGEGVEMPDEMFDDVAGGAAVMNASTLNAATLNKATINSATLNQATLNQSTLNASTLNSSTVNASTLNSSTLNSSKLNGSVLNKSNYVLGGGFGSFLSKLQGGNK